MDDCFYEVASLRSNLQWWVQDFFPLHTKANSIEINAMKSSEGLELIHKK